MTCSGTPSDPGAIVVEAVFQSWMVDPEKGQLLWAPQGGTGAAQQPVAPASMV
jgi:hypothetical protein